jgi:hypothetical protein
VDADLLGRGPFVDSLIRALVADKLDDSGNVVGRYSTGYVVGLTGRWGLGKSSVLNLLEKKLDDMNFVVVAVFNPWLFNGRDELVTGFFNALRSALGNSSSEDARKLLSSIDRYWGAINFAGHSVAAVIDVNGASGAATAVWRSLVSRLKGAVPKPIPRTPEQEKESLEDKIRELNWSVVVLIDELDRVEDDEVRAVAQLVKALGDIKGISYLVSYDPDRVSEALGKGDSPEERRQSGERYIEKIIQHPIPLRPLFPTDKKALLANALANCNAQIEAPQIDSQREIHDHLIEAIQTPREIKRLIGAFSILEKAVRGEICPYDLLGYCWLLTKSPALRDEIASKIDKLVNDPSYEEMASRLSNRRSGRSEQNFVDILGQRASDYEEIISRLFPRFNESYVETGTDGERICKRRNLVRLLYLGNPPGALRRVEIERLWDITDLNVLTVEIRKLAKDGMLPEFLDRLDDLLTSLPPSGDAVFWLGLSKAFVRNSDWVRGDEATRALADDAATLLIRLVTRDRNNKHRLLSAIENLIADNDLVLVPFILRKHLFAYGLTNHDEDPRGGDILRLAETEDLLAREIPRYRKAILEGFALRRLPHLEIIYTLLNTDNWDTELRDSFTNQLDSLESVLSMAALTVPPGYGASRSMLDKLFNTDIVLSRVKNEFDINQSATDPWLNVCLQRFIDILEGRRPEFE